MADISEWSTVEAENTHIDELTLSGESGQYINKVMCAVKAWADDQDADVVHKTGSEEISGVKTFTNETIAIKNPNHDSSQAISERKFYNIDFLDSNNVNVGRIRYRFETNGSVSVFMQAKKQGGNLDSYFDIRIAEFPRINAAGNVFAYPSNTYSLGEADCLWSVVYAATGAIDTSDERLKSSIADISDAVLDAWENVSWMQYKFNDAVEKKGDDARVHVGLIAQRVKDVFEANGVDPSQYGFFCHDEWEAQEEERDEDGKILRAARPAGDAYAMRYEEALCIEAAYQRRRADRLESRIAALEAALNGSD